MRVKEIYCKFNQIIRKRNQVVFKGKQSFEYQKFNFTLSRSLSLLKEEYSMILNKTYFDCSYKFWWVDYYSKTCFYNKRFIAISSFVHLFYVIYENFNDFII